MIRRVVITGLGVCAPGSAGAPGLWAQLTSGQSATGPITLFDPGPYRSRIAAQADFDPAARGLSPEQCERLDRAAQFALVSAREALADSGLSTTLPLERTGVALGTAAGQVTRLSTEYALISDCGTRWDLDHTQAVPHLLDYLQPASLAAEVALDAGAQGPVSLHSTGCTAGLHALGHAAALIREGSADVMIAGGTEAPIAPITVACFDALKLTSARNEEPATASRPFDRTRDGFVLGEGCAVLVLEELTHARRRGARLYAESAGYATRSSGHHMTALRRGGHDLAGAITAALAQGRTHPATVDYVSAHAPATRPGDPYETDALKRALGHHARNASVSSTKSMIGYALGASGALDAATAALALHHNVVPPTANLHTPDPACDLDYTPHTARERPLSGALVLATGFAGLNSALLLRRPPTSRGAE